MIPVCLVPVYGRWDLTLRMLGSMAEPVERGLLVDNRRDFEEQGWKRELVPSGFTVLTPPFESLGWGGTLNFGIMQTPDAPWWMWCTNDIVLGPNTMATLENVMEEAADTPVVITHRWAVGALNRAVVERVGLFDEWSYHPIYFEDTDYAWRCHLAGVEVRIDPLGVAEGDGDIDHSTTTRSNPELSMANNRTWAMNERAYAQKWGGLPGHERYRRPYDDPHAPLWATRPDLGGRVARRWPKG